ncbi:hypothetical protein EWZ71_05850 [Helicobacter pylori]|nr:hypothetical protein [Helicobacter pylori]OPG26760.1 hypothetical protein BGL63_05515 [Helicobacter pylori]
MNALKKLSFCALLSLGLFAQTAHAHSLKDTINYPDWLKVNFFKTTQAEIPNIFSVWDECFSSARNYIKTLSETNLDFLYTP